MGSVFQIVLENRTMTQLLTLACLVVFSSIITLTTSQQNCRLTTRDVEGPFYESGAPEVIQVAPSNELNDPNTDILIEGTVLNKQCRPITNAVVDIWYAGGNPIGYTFPPAKLWYRGRGRTDGKGKYVFKATYPGVYSGRPIPHIHYKVFAGGKELTTQLYFENDVPPSFEDYVARRGSQFAQNVQANPNGRIFTFNLVLDVQN